jgi:hemerythrin-like domain-containing protein
MSIPLTLRVIRDEHNALSAMLQSLHLLIRQGPEDDPKRFFATLRAMLFYIDEYPERLHHPKETELLFPRVANQTPEAAEAVRKLDQDHVYSERAVRELQHLLLAWELLGESRRADFVAAFTKYVNHYREHMLLEETAILPVAEQTLSAEEWAEVDAAFAANRDPLTGKYPAEGIYEELFKRIVHDAPAPIGFGG